MHSRMSLLKIYTSAHHCKNISRDKGKILKVSKQKSTVFYEGVIIRMAYGVGLLKIAIL